MAGVSMTGWRNAPYLRTAEALAVLGCGTRDLARLVESGALPCHWGPDKHRRFLPKDVARVLRSTHAQQRAATVAQPPLWGRGSRGGRP
jgi:hypothetical protein